MAAPRERGGEPRWGTKPFPKSDRAGRFVVLASGFAEDTDALLIRADARVLGTTLPAGQFLAYDMAPGRKAYLVATSGRITLNDGPLEARDGAAVREERTLRIAALADTEIVLVMRSDRTAPCIPGHNSAIQETETRMGKLDGKIAVITGANSGIGLASAKRFAREGARVFMTGRRQAELDAAVAEVGVDARGIQGDVANLGDLDRLDGIVRDEAGRIDVLLANAGSGELMPLHAITEEHYDRTFATNVKGTLFTVQKALPLLRDSASVILTGSANGNKGGVSFSVYSASKAAIRKFARSWIQELAPRRIRVNVLVPGATSTPGLHGLFPTEEMNRAVVAMMEAAAPAGRIGSPDEIANAALFLASDESSYVNGSELFVDGGAAQI